MREDRRRPWVGVTGAMSVIHTYLATVLLLIPSIAAMLLSELSWALSSSPSFPAGSHGKGPPERGMREPQRSMKDIRWDRSARTGFRRTLSISVSSTLSGNLPPLGMPPAVLANADTVLSQLFGLVVSTATLYSTSVASAISCSSPYPHKVAGAYFSLHARSRIRADMPHATMIPTAAPTVSMMQSEKRAVRPDENS